MYVFIVKSVCIKKIINFNNLIAAEIFNAMSIELGLQ